jgi:urocanate reductase
MKKIENMRQKILIVFACIAVLVVLYDKFTTLPEYEGKGKGFFSEVWVRVTMDGKEIKNIIVTKHGDTPEIVKIAINNLIPEIILNQSLEVDTVAGATYTSKGIKEAVREAIVKAGVNFE